MEFAIFIWLHPTPRKALFVGCSVIAQLDEQYLLREIGTEEIRVKVNQVRRIFGKRGEV